MAVATIFCTGRLLVTPPNESVLSSSMLTSLKSIIALALRWTADGGDDVTDGAVTKFKFSMDFSSFGFKINARLLGEPVDASTVVGSAFSVCIVGSTVKLPAVTSNVVPARKKQIKTMLSSPQQRCMAWPANECRLIKQSLMISLLDRNVTSNCRLLFMELIGGGDKLTRMTDKILAFDNCDCCYLTIISIIVRWPWVCWRWSMSDPPPREGISE